MSEILFQVIYVVAGSFIGSILGIGLAELWLKWSIARQLKESEQGQQVEFFGRFNPDE